MPRLLASTRTAQEDIVRRCENAEPGGVSRRRIAQIAGVDPSLISMWTSDGDNGREMPWCAVRRLADQWGWDVVLGEDARAAGFEVERPMAAPTPDALGTSLALVSEAADVPKALIGGIRNREDRERALRELDEVQAKIDAIRAALIGGAKAVA